MLNRIYIIIVISILLITTSCAHDVNRTKVSDINLEQQERLNDYITQIDNCYVREINRLDDGVTDIRQVVELVNWKCKGHYTTVKNMLFKDFGVGLGYAFQFTEKMKNAGTNKIAESLIAKRKIEKKTNKSMYKRYEKPDRKGFESKPFYDESY